MHQQSQFSEIFLILVLITPKVAKVSLKLLALFKKYKLSWKISFCDSIQAFDK